MNRFSVPDKCASDCGALAPLLTELFDGEADDAAAARARAHLLSCQACARLWLDWNQHRNILRNDNAPAPPPTLLWRVLVACRVSAPTRSQSRSALRPELSLHQLEAPVPSALSAHILARTSRAPQTRKKSNAISRAVMVTPLLASKPARLGRFSLAVPAVAAPALALCLLLLSRADLTVLMPPLAPRNTLAAPPAHQLSAPAASTVSAAESEPLAPSAAPAPLQTRLISLAPARAVAAAAVLRGAPVARAEFSGGPRAMVPRGATLQQSGSGGAELNRMIVLTLETARRQRASSPQMPVAAPAFGAREVGATPVELASHKARLAAVSAVPVSAAPVASARPQRAAALLPALSPRPRVITLSSARLRPASFSGKPRAPRSRLALAQIAPAPRRASDDDGQSLRVSRPAPLTPGVRLASLSLGESNGPRLEDLRSAVDDFRASISDGASGDG